MSSNPIIDKKIEMINAHFAFSSVLPPTRLFSFPTFDVYPSLPLFSKNNALDKMDDMMCNPHDKNDMLKTY